MVLPNRISVFFFLSITYWESSGITNKRSFAQYGENVRNFRHIAGPSTSTDFTDWEVGLRESVNQALLREGYYDPNLRERILRAPIIGKENSASPFGDVVILARGQLYALNAGNFAFVQDPYSNDCDECHNTKRLRCDVYLCRDWRQSHQKRLVALWSVKRLRHRTYDNYQYEIQYTISPITPSIDEEYVTRNGGYDYAIPGHVFITKNDNPYKNHPTEVYTEVYNKKHPAGHYKPEILLAVDQHGHKHFLHSYPGFFTSLPIHPTRHQVLSTNDPKEIDLYKKLIETLSQKTSTTNKVESQNKFTYAQPDIVTKPQYEAYPTTIKEVKPLTTIYVPDREPFRPVTHTTVPPISQTQATSVNKDEIKTTFHFFVPIGEELMVEKELVKITSASVPVPKIPSASTPVATITSPSAPIGTVPSITTPISTVSETILLEKDEGFLVPLPTTITTQRTTEKHKITSTEHVKIQSTTEFPKSVQEIKPTPQATKKYVPVSTIKTQTTKTAKPVTIRTQIITEKARPVRNETTPHKLSTTISTTSSKSTPSLPTITRTTAPMQSTAEMTSQISRKSTTKTPIKSTSSTTQARPTYSKQVFSTKRTRPVGMAHITKVTKPLQLSTGTSKPTSTFITTSTQFTQKSTQNETIPLKTTSDPSTIPVLTIISGTSKVTESTKPITTPRLEVQTEPIIYPEPEITTPMQIVIEKTSQPQPTEHLSTTPVAPQTSPLVSMTTVSEAKLPNKTTYSSTFSAMTSLQTTTVNINELTEELHTLPKHETTHTVEQMSTVVPEVPPSPKETTQEPMNLEEDQTISLHVRTTTETSPKQQSFEKETTTEIIESGETYEITKPIFIETTTPFISELEVEKTSSTSTLPTTVSTDSKEITLSHLLPSTNQITILNQQDNVQVKTTTSKPTTTNGFLSNGVSVHEPVIYVKPIKQDYTDEDIFGSTKSTRKPTSTTLKRVSDSDFALELFSKYRRTRKRSRTSPKVIFSNFYAASTVPMPSNEDTSQQPMTSQSVETSISYEINKRKKYKSKIVESSTVATADESINRNNSLEVEMVDTKKAFDDIALQLVNHARTIDYLSQQKNSTARPKYRRRKTYVPKSRRPKTKKNH